MNIEDQVCSLELSKRLKELGVRQESLFYWWDGDDINDEGHSVSRIEIENNDSAPSNFVVYSAFTVAELGEMLPKEIWHPNKHKPMVCRPANRLCHWVVYYDKDTWTEENSEANARARMLIHLIENGLMEVPK